MPHSWQLPQLGMALQHPVAVVLLDQIGRLVLTRLALDLCSLDPACDIMGKALPDLPRTGAAAPFPCHFGTDMKLVHLAAPSLSKAQCPNGIDVPLLDIQVAIAP